MGSTQHEPEERLLSVAAELMQAYNEVGMPLNVLLLVQGMDEEGEPTLYAWVGGQPNIFTEIGMLQARLQRLLDFVSYSGYDEED
jgi:hypothetical protein